MKRHLHLISFIFCLLFLQLNGKATSAPEVDSTIWCYAHMSWQIDTADCHQVEFQDESEASGTIISWFWSFGDPASGTCNNSTAENPTHTFSAAGTYIVEHAIATSDGCSSTIHDTIVIDPPCNAHYHFQPAAENPLHVHFWDPNMPEGSVVAWYWNFGDGTPMGTTPDPWHVFPAPGHYNVCLEIVTACGTSCSYCDTIYVEAPCNAEFHYQVDSTNPGNIHFWNDATPPEIIAGYLWDFGDGSTSTDPDPWHEYSGPNLSHTVCLWIETIYGTTCHACETISTGVPCDAHYHFQQATENPLHVHFWDDHMPAGTVAAYQWDFGDGTPFGTTPDPWHIYLAPGKYNVCLIIHTIYGDVCDYCDSITIHNTYDVNGHVLLNGLYADDAMVYLIRIDSASYMSVIDSTEIQDTCAYYHFGGVQPGSYYTRSFLLPSSVHYGDYAPTYFEEALLWQEANVINPAGGNNVYNIHMVPDPLYPSGNGTISGSVTEGTKITEGGTPSPGVVVLIFDASDQILDYTVTDSQGKFLFPDIGMGTYKIYPEYPGKVTTPVTVTLDQGNLTSDLAFVIKGDKILLGLDGPATTLLNNVSQVYPSPAANTASINISVIKATRVNISVVSLTGEKVWNTQSDLITGSCRLSWDVSKLNSGVYFVRISDNSGGVLVRKFVVIR